jgi:glycosyltransferase involved in cell wall biosynthesis
VIAGTDSSVGRGGPGARAAGGGLHVHLEVPLPRELAVGGGTAVFVCGWCVAPAGRIRELSLVVDGDAQPVAAHGMPRLDVLRGLHPRVDPFAMAGLTGDPGSEDDPGLHGYRSGFWGLARVVPRAGRDVCEVALRAQLDGGATVEAELGGLPLVTHAAPVTVAAPEPAAGPLVAICMATYEPSMDLLGPQLDSIRAQTYGNWVCIVSDDCSRPESFAALQAAVEGDRRFVVSRSSERLGFYHNFERALGMAPADAGYVAMADQDDVWHPDKLAALLDEIGGAELIYSDARIVRPDGEVVSETYWSRRRNNHSSLLSLLVANSVTGAASLFRRDLLDDALPFPPAQFAHFHDHWIALTALARGRIAFCDRPVYDYVQHGEASLGHAAANQIMTLRNRLGMLRRDPRERVRMWRTRYFVDVSRLMQVATVLRMRCGDRMTARKRRAVDRFLRADSSAAALGALWARGARELVGRPETLGAEWMLTYALLWRRMTSAVARDRPVRTLRLDAIPPANLVPQAGKTRPDNAPARLTADKIEPLRLAIREDAPERVNLLIPTVDLAHFFGGYIAKFNLARRLAERGLRVRIVTVDPQAPLPSSWARQVEAYEGLDGLFEHVEVAFGRESPGLEVSRSDRFVATTWWSAHLAADAARRLGGEPFLYLVQEYEPFTFMMGSYAALAAQSYGFPHFALFSTEFLRDYFRRHGIGVYAQGTAAGDAASASFENAITVVEPPGVEDLARRRTRRLLFYARPEPHAARNMFELGVLALARAIELGAFRAPWELHGIGTLNAGRRIEFGGGIRLDLLPRSEQGAYADVLRGHDVGLALMYTPHPSLVPIEMASAGMLTVTNSFENKTPEAMAAVSSNLLTMEPTIDSVAAGLCEAAAGAEDFERRARGGTVDWSRDWNRSFDDDLLDRLVAFLGA